MNQINALLDRLDSHVQALSAAHTAPETFKVLLNSLPLMAPRAAIFLARGDRLRGWNGWGIDAQATESLKQHEVAMSADARAGWLAGELGSRADQDGALDFGQGAPADRMSLAVRIQGVIVAVLMIERMGTELPWNPKLMSILRTFAEIQLEAALIKKRLATTPAASASSSVNPAYAAAADPPVVAPSPRAEPDSAAEESGSTLSIPMPVADFGAADSPAASATETDDNPQLAAAKRFARLVATDIRLYNEEAVLQGRRNGDLVERLDEHISRGKETFLQRHGVLGPVGIEILLDAYVQVLAGGDAALLPSSVLEGS